MRIAHVIPTIDKNSGGTSAYMKSLIEALSDEIHQDLICFDSEVNIEINATVDIKLSKQKTLSRIHSRSIQMTLENAKPDIFHGNGLWESPIRQMSKVAQKQRIPFVISPHGMFEDWSLQQSKLKKKIALNTFQYKDMQNATCLHATAIMEADNFRKKGLKNPIAVIPNGIDLKDFPLKEVSKNNTPKKMLFLSRIHYKKGLEILIEAWHQLPSSLTKGWQIDIIGNGDEDYIDGLKSIISEKGLDESICIKSPVYGVEKIKAYQDADLFILPTFSENFGIVVVEALSCGTPVITTKGAPWEELNQYGCGWWIDIGVEPLIAILKDILVMSSTELLDKGKLGRNLVEKKYSMQAVAQQMYSLYKWILNPKSSKPDFVRLN